jgi:hypothetical protein
MSDTVFWVWGEENDYGCGGLSRIDSSILPMFGTGCDHYNKGDDMKPKPKMPMYRYNFMFLY